jgi:spore coat protein JB
VQERKKLLKEYAEAYGPLIIDITDQTGESIWKWMEQPFPWEKEGACR